MLSQRKSLDFSIVYSNSYSKLYFTFWAWSDYRSHGAEGRHMGDNAEVMDLWAHYSRGV